MKEVLMDLFTIIGCVATMIGCIYGVGRFAEFLCEINTRVRLLEEDIKKLRELVILTKIEKNET